MSNKTWNEKEIEEEANRLGWTIDQLKRHLAKEERIKEVLKSYENEEEGE